MSRKLAVFGIGAFAVSVLGALVWNSYLDRPSAATINGDLVLRAVQRFWADHQPPPQTVTFHELIAQGYLKSDVLEKFGASEITVNLRADNTYPQLFLMDAQMPDGTHVTLLSDGSVQQLSKTGFPQVQDQKPIPHRLRPIRQTLERLALGEPNIRRDH